MTADRLWSEWQADAERIRKDTVELFSFRRQFREIQEIFAGNAHLQAVGGHVWDWIRRAYVWTVLARLRHEAVCEGNGVSLRQLLEEIERRPDVVTRGRVLSRVSERDMRLL